MASIGKHELTLFSLACAPGNSTFQRANPCPPWPLPQPGAVKPMYLGRPKLDVACPERTFRGTSAYSALSQVGAGRIAKPLAESPRKMRIFAEAASVGNLTQRLISAL